MANTLKIKKSPQNHSKVTIESPQSHPFYKQVFALIIMLFSYLRIQFWGCSVKSSITKKKDKERILFPQINAFFYFSFQIFSELFLSFSPPLPFFYDYKKVTFLYFTVTNLIFFLYWNSHSHGRIIELVIYKYKKNIRKLYIF